MSLVITSTEWGLGRIREVAEAFVRCNGLQFGVARVQCSNRPPARALDVSTLVVPPPVSKPSTCSSDFP
jgi:hypothetical protein